MNKKTKIVKKKHRKARLRMKAKQRELLKNKVSVTPVEKVKAAPKKKTTKKATTKKKTS